MQISRRNRYDSRDSLELGDNAQNAFLKIATLKGWRITEATNEQDINEHWDYEMKKSVEKYKVDVKAMKRLRRHDPEVQDEWSWVELHGVRLYDLGWLYNGKADLIAFETKKSFLIVKRTDLITLVDQLVDKNTFVKTAGEAKYKVYRRFGRPDVITLIETAKLAQIKWDEWEKVPDDRVNNKGK